MIRTDATDRMTATMEQTKLDALLHHCQRNAVACSSSVMTGRALICHSDVIASTIVWMELMNTIAMLHRRRQQRPVMNAMNSHVMMEPVCSGRCDVTINMTVQTDRMNYIVPAWRISSCVWMASVSTDSWSATKNTIVSMELMNSIAPHCHQSSCVPPISSCVKKTVGALIQDASVIDTLTVTITPTNTTASLQHHLLDIV
jgi:hypothetical protein